MTPQQQDEEERHAALMAVQGALTAGEREKFMAGAAGRWPLFKRQVGVSPADVLDYTDDYDEFLDQTEPFFEQYGDRFPDSPAVRMAAHALLILGDGRISDLSVDGINDLLRRAGVLEPPDDEPESYDPSDDLAVVLLAMIDGGYRARTSNKTGDALARLRKHVNVASEDQAAMFIRDLVKGA